MNQRYSLLHIDAIESERSHVETLAHEWSRDKDFWDADSCIKTLLNAEEYLTAAIVDNQSETRPWIACYFAIRQGEVWDLLYIYVGTNHRRQNLGAALLNDMIQRASSLAIHQSNDELRIILEVKASNISAQKLYERLGFENFSIRKNYYQNGEDALLYKLNRGHKGKFHE